MERLTNDECICLDCESIGHCREYCFEKLRYDKLKDYEDLGFSPEEIACLAKFYKEQTSVETITANMKIVAKLLEAERKEAYWIKRDWAEENEGLLIPNYECSKCHTWKRDDSDYCPDCGCKMMEVK